MFERPRRRQDETEIRVAPRSQPAPSAILALQRSAGNAAVARMIKGRTSGPVIQRVGGKKLSFVARPKSPEVLVGLLRDALAKLHDEDKTRKNDFERDELAKMPKDKGPASDKQRKPIVMEAYPKVLVDGDRVARLEQTQPFKDKVLRLGRHDASSEFIEVLDENGTVIADVSVGAGASHIPDLIGENEKPKSERLTTTKLDDPGKRYVADNRGVPTRRYAYMEKSYYQFMELVATGVMTGRFQLLHTALREVPKLLSLTPTLGALLSPDDKPLTSLKPEQLAILHQWMGSQMQQRGLSLTSTPREHAVYANEGEAFRTADGVRLKIDLFKVPQGVLLINHHGDGGVKDDMTGVNPNLATGRKVDDTRDGQYGYIPSVIKNRELYLEYLDPEWIVGIDAHGVPAGPTTATGAKLIDQVGRQAGFDDYAKGFQAALDALSKGLVAPDTSKDKDSPFAKGVSSGETYMKGYDAGGKERDPFANGVTAAIDKIRALRTAKKKSEEERIAAAKQQAESMRNPKAKTALAAARHYVATTYLDLGLDGLNMIVPTNWLAVTALAANRDEYDVYWIGWAHAARGERPHPMDKHFY